MTSFHQRFLGKIYSVTFCLSAEDLSEENVAYMRTLRFPFLDFLVSSVQFSGNNKSFINHPINHGFPVDAPSKLDNAKHGGQRLPITLRLRLRSWDVFADDLLPNHLRLVARFLDRSAPNAPT